jgi:hypothetical protein
MLLLFAQAMREAQGARSFPEEEWISVEGFREFIARILDHADHAVASGWADAAAERGLVETRYENGGHAFRLTRRGRMVARPFP